MNRTSLSKQCHTTFVLCLAISFATPPRVAAQSDTPSQTPAPPASPDDAAAKAAERKKRFEESKKLLENKDPEPPPASKATPSKPAENSAKPTAPEHHNPLVFSIVVNIFVGESQRFLLFDDSRNNLTARATWTTSDPSIADISFSGGMPTFTAKKTRSATIFANVNSQTASILLNVLNNDQRSASVVRWNQTPPAIHPPLEIVPAIPMSAKLP